MKITAIKQQVKRSNRYSVEVDGKYAFSLGESQLIASGFYNGLELSETQLEEYKHESDAGKQLDRLLNLLSYRARSEWELREYMRRHKVEAAQADELVRRLQKFGYVDDQAFAEAWVESRRQTKTTSRRKLQSELQAKRVPRDIIDQVLNDDSQTTDETNILAELVAKKRTKYPDEIKLMQYLARQGYNYSDIKDVLRRSRSDLGDSLE